MTDNLEAWAGRTIMKAIRRRKPRASFIEEDLVITLDDLPPVESASTTQQVPDEQQASSDNQNNAGSAQQEIEMAVDDASTPSPE